MFVSILVPIFLTLMASAISTPEKSPRSTKAPAYSLAGDSTTAIQSSSGGGWGNGFLSFLKSPAWGINYGHNGATTVSFVAGGDWANVIAHLKNYTAAFDCYVTIQFGHNDQKATANISLAEYQNNLENLIVQVKAPGGTPLLVTPLTRRAFTSEHNATDSLHDQRLATIAAANATATRMLDLNQASLTYVDVIGSAAAQAYDLGGTDTTHLNDWGSVVFGRMVADLLLGHPPVIDANGTVVEYRKSDDSGDVGEDAGRADAEYFKPWILPNETLSYEIWHGIPAL